MLLYLLVDRNTPYRFLVYIDIYMYVHGRKKKQCPAVWMFEFYFLTFVCFCCGNTFSQQYSSGSRDAAAASVSRYEWMYESSTTPTKKNVLPWPRRSPGGKLSSYIYSCTPIYGLCCDPPKKEQSSVLRLSYVYSPITDSCTPCTTHTALHTTPNNAIPRHTAPPQWSPFCHRYTINQYTGIVCASITSWYIRSGISWTAASRAPLKVFNILLVALKARYAWNVEPPK